MQTEHLKYTKMNFKDFFSIMIHCNWPKSFAMLMWDIWWTSQVSHLPLNYQILLIQGLLKGRYRNV